jgi:hypothetical protein
MYRQHDRFEAARRMIPDVIRRRVLDWAPAASLCVLLVGYAAAMLPALLPGRADYAQLWTTSSDQTVMYRIFFDFMGGQLTHGTVYGGVAYEFVALLLLPALVLMHVAGVSIGFAGYSIIIAVTQLVVALTAFIYLYRLSALISNRWLAVLGVALAMCMTDVFETLVQIKPDDWQMMATVATLFHLCRHTHRSLRGVRQPDWSGDLVWAAFWFGISVSARVTAVLLGASFAAAVAICVLQSSPSLLAALTRAAAQLGLAGAVTAATFVVTSPQWIAHYRELRDLYGFAAHAFNSADLGQALTDLFWPRVANFVSGRLDGPVLPVCYLFSMVAVHFGRRAVAAHFGSVRNAGRSVINAYVVTVLLAYFTLYRDTFNIYGGDRYFVALMLPVVAAVLSWAATRTTLLLRVLAASAVIASFGWAGAQSVGAAGFEWQPLRRMVHKDVFKQWINTFNPDDKRFVSSVYSLSPDGYVYSLRSLSRAEWARVEKTPGLAPQMTFSGKSTAIWPNLAAYYNIKQLPNFTARDWIRRNAPPGSVVVTDFYIDLLDDPDCYTPNDDLPAGVRIVRADWDKALVTVPQVARDHPDFVVTRYGEIAAQIEAQLPQYRMAAALSAPNGPTTVWILRRDAAHL